MFKSVRFLAVAALAVVGMFVASDNASAGILFNRNKCCKPTTCCATPTPCCATQTACCPTPQKHLFTRSTKSCCPTASCCGVTTAVAMAPMVAPATVLPASATAPVATPVVAGGCCPTASPCCPTASRHHLLGRRHQTCCATSAPTTGCCN